MDWRLFFKGKKITQLGLGLLGRGVGDAVFLAECGADLIVTDKKTEEELLPSVEKLRAFPNVTLHLGGHDLADFSAQGGQARPDFILKGAGVPLDSPYIAEARKNGIPIEMDASLFFKLAPKVTTIGVTGTRGKSTTTHLIFHILKQAGKCVFLAGNVKDTASLPLLKEVKEGDYIVAELDSWQLQGFGPTSHGLRGASENGMSPHIAVFTTFFPDHLNYYGSTSFDVAQDEKLTTSAAMDRYFEDKANIFKYQNEGDVLVVGEQALSVRSDLKSSKGQTLVARTTDVPIDWTLQILGEHNRANVVCAILAVRALGISDDVIKTAVESFKGVPGRLELIREINGVKIYNDTTATTPEATLVALRAFSRGSTLDLQKVEPRERRIVLICGGTDKGLDMSELAREIPKYCKAAILLAGSGTKKLQATSYQLPANTIEVTTLDEAVREALSRATDGDIVLFSPAFASFSKYFKNEYDRGEQFDKIVKNIV